MTRNVTKQVAKVTTVKHNTRLNPGPSGCVFQMLWECESGSGKTWSKAKRTHDSKSGLVSEVRCKNKASEKCHPVSNAVNVYLTKQSNNFSGTIVLQIISALELFTSTEIVELCPVMNLLVSLGFILLKIHYDTLLAICNSYFFVIKHKRYPKLQW